MSAHHLPYAAYRQTVWNRTWLALTTLAAALAASLLCLFAYWLFWPYEGLTRYSVELTNPVVSQGELLYGEIDYCVDANVPLPMRIDREIVLQNHIIAFPVTDLQYAITERCEHKGRVLGIPDYAPAGTYHLAITTTVTVNPLRTIRQSWVSQPFVVKAKAK
jgi:hypothetical protein